MANKKRPEEAYFSKAQLQGYRVLNFLMEKRGVPYTITAISEEAELTYDQVRRSLVTMKALGFAARTDADMWVVGEKLTKRNPRAELMGIKMLRVVEDVYGKTLEL